MSDKAVRRLTKYWQGFCTENRLPLMSADDLLFDHGDQIPLELKLKIQAFIQTWEKYSA